MSFISLTSLFTLSLSYYINFQTNESFSNKPINPYSLAVHVNATTTNQNDTFVVCYQNYDNDESEHLGECRLGKYNNNTKSLQFYAATHYAQNSRSNYQIQVYNEYGPTNKILISYTGYDSKSNDYAYANVVVGEFNTNTGEMEFGFPEELNDEQRSNETRIIQLARNNSYYLACYSHGQKEKYLGLSCKLVKYNSTRFEKEVGVSDTDYLVEKNVTIKGISLHRLNDYNVLVCYGVTANITKQGICRIATINDYYEYGLNANITYNQTIIFNNDTTEYITTNIINETSFVICYSSNNYGACSHGYSIDIGNGGVYIGFGSNSQYKYDNKYANYSSSVTIPVNARYVDNKNELVVVCYAQNNATSNGVCTVGEINNATNVINFQNSTQKFFADNYVESVSVQYLGNNSVVVCYTDGNTQSENYQGQCVYGVVEA